MDAKTTLELEQAQRRRVEARLKVAESSAQVLTPQSQSHKTGGGASGASMNNINLTPTNTGGPHMGGMGVGETPSSIEVRTRMLYGDVNDMDETEQEGGYDNDMLSRYQLDNESAMAAIGASPSTSPNREDTSTQESKSNRYVEPHAFCSKRHFWICNAPLAPIHLITLTPNTLIRFV